MKTINITLSYDRNLEELQAAFAEAISEALKPKVKRCRMGLRFGRLIMVHYEDQMKLVEDYSGFDRWLTDWIEYK